jgi:hypothetical protein
MQLLIYCAFFLQHIRYLLVQSHIIVFELFNAFFVFLHIFFQITQFLILYELLTLETL